MYKIAMLCKIIQLPPPSWDLGAGSQKLCILFTNIKEIGGLKRDNGEIEVSGEAPDPQSFWTKSDENVESAIELLNRGLFGSFSIKTYSIDDFCDFPWIPLSRFLDFPNPPSHGPKFFDNNKGSLTNLVQPYLSHWPGKWTTKISKPKLAAFYIAMRDSISIQPDILEAVKVKNTVLCEFLSIPRNLGLTEVMDTGSGAGTAEAAQLMTVELERTGDMINKGHKIEEPKREVKNQPVMLLIRDHREMQVQAVSHRAFLPVWLDAATNELRVDSQVIIEEIRNVKKDTPGGRITLTADQIFGDVFSDEFMKGTLHDGVAYPATQYLIVTPQLRLTIHIHDVDSADNSLLDTGDDSMLHLTPTSQKHKLDETEPGVPESSPTKSKKARASTSDDDRKVIKWLCDILKDREGYENFTKNRSKSLQNPDIVIQWAFIAKFSLEYHKSERPEAVGSVFLVSCLADLFFQNGKTVTKAHLEKALMIGASTLTQAEKGHSQVLRFTQAGSPSFNEEVKKELEAIRQPKPQGIVQLTTYLNDKAKGKEVK
ncbi:hypothetical protein C8J56DRAFT_897099 [Mycena floridula]|nr:hypothetical protein C8J56DRAFT_897099 [Mycena floridula]